MFNRLKTWIGKTSAPKPDFVMPAGSVISPMPEPTALPNSEASAQEYPVDCLSPGIRRIVDAIANKTQGPPAIAAQAVLAAVSLTFGSHTKVKTLGSLANTASYFVLIASSGERKSAADGLAMGGVNDTVLELREEHGQAIERYEQEVADLDRGGKRPPKPVCPNFLVTESTIEGAFKAIASGAGILGWCTDEAASFWGGHSMSKDKQALTAGILSKLWDGAFFIRPRVTQEGDGYVPPTPTTVNLMFQPTLISATYGNPFLLGQGILARMLPAWPESYMGSRKYRPPSAQDLATIDQFQAETAAALRATLADPTERTMDLSDGALTACIKFHDDIEGVLGRGQWAAEVSSFAAKGPEHACRLAALMTLYEDREATSISAEMMTNACLIVKYYLAQFKYLCIAGKNDTCIAHAQILLDWLRLNVTPAGGFATDRIMQSGPVSTRNAKALDQALAILIQHDWIAKLPDGTVIDRKKRRKAYMMNPAV